MGVRHQVYCPQFRCERSANQKQQGIEQMLSERRRDDMGEIQSNRDKKPSLLSRGPTTFEAIMAQSLSSKWDNDFLDNPK